VVDSRDIRQTGIFLTFVASFGTLSALNAMVLSKKWNWSIRVMARKTRRSAPELLIQKTRHALHLALIEKQLAKQVWEMTSPKEGLPTSPDHWHMSRQSGELLTAARRFACLEHCLNNEILWMNSAWAMYQALLPEDPQDVEVLFPQDHF
jgi:hypothetical protein